MFYNYEISRKKDIKNLKKSFTGESSANRKYLAFTASTEKESVKQIVKLFRANVEVETIHTLNHLKTLGEVNSTLDNPNAVIKSEHFEYTEMYLLMLEDIKQE